MESLAFVALMFRDYIPGNSQGEFVPLAFVEGKLETTHGEPPNHNPHHQLEGIWRNISTIMETSWFSGISSNSWSWFWDPRKSLGFFIAAGAENPSPRSGAAIATAWHVRRILRRTVQAMLEEEDCGGLTKGKTFLPLACFQLSLLLLVLNFFSRWLRKAELDATIPGLERKAEVSCSKTKYL